MFTVDNGICSTLSTAGVADSAANWLRSSSMVWLQTRLRKTFCFISSAHAPFEEKRSFSLADSIPMDEWKEFHSMHKYSSCCLKNYTDFIWRMPRLFCNWRCSLMPTLATMTASIFGHNLPTDWAREVFKPSTDLVSLLVSIEKTILWFRFGVLCGWHHKWECCVLLWTTLPGPGHQPNEPFFGSCFF